MQQIVTPTAPDRRAGRWLPDAALDAHRLATWALRVGAGLWIHVLYKPVALFPADFRIAPGTLITFNHQRDADGPILGVTLERKRREHFQWPLPIYASREDLFRAGILSRLSVRWPRPLPALLGHVSLAWFFPLARVEPIRRVAEFPLGDTVGALIDAGCGQIDCAALLNARGRRELGIKPGDMRLHEVPSRIGSPLEVRRGLRRITLAALRKIAPAFRATVEAHLAHFAARLDQGHSLYFSPEGTTSKNGHFGRARAGLFRLANMAEAPPWIQPIGVSYDPLQAGRTRAIMRAGKRFRADTRLDRRAFDAVLRHTLLEVASVTPSHLLARFLLHGPATFTTSELAQWLARSRTVLRTLGASLDPGLTQTDTEELARQRLRWLTRKRLVAREGKGFRTTCPRDARPRWGKPANAVHYLDNALADLVPDPDRTLPC